MGAHGELAAAHQRQEGPRPCRAGGRRRASRLRQRETAKPAPPKKPPRRGAGSASKAKGDVPAASPCAHCSRRRKARRLSSGRIEIEARVDLHGMRQSEAHDTLRRFLKPGHAGASAGCSSSPERGAGATATGRARLAREGFERGVLRRNVPRWLAEPELAGIVVGFTTAAIHHGGEGALYVQLRNREPRPGEENDYAAETPLLPFVR